MSLLQELLNVGAMDIGSDDSRFEKMQAAASALSTRFGEEPRLLIPATLVSLDNNVDEDDPMFALVEELVIAEWKTLRNTHVNRPRELLRSIVIDALATATDKFALERQAQLPRRSSRERVKLQKQKPSTATALLPRLRGSSTWASHYPRASH